MISCYDEWGQGGTRFPTRNETNGRAAAPSYPTESLMLLPAPARMCAPSATGVVRYPPPAVGPLKSRNDL